jgi:hypothetical protein
MVKTNKSNLKQGLRHTCTHLCTCVESERWYIDCKSSNSRTKNSERYSQFQQYNNYDTTIKLYENKFVEIGQLVYSVVLSGLPTRPRLELQAHIIKC